MLAAIIEFVKNVRSNFFMPGHKFGKNFSHQFRENIFSLDVTEFDETDNLQHPNGIIKNSQIFASNLYKTQDTYFITCGSSAAILAMIMGVCGENDTIIVDRNCHTSVINGIILSGANPVFIYPQILKDFNIYGSFEVTQLERILNENSDVKAVIITYPNYYGVCSDIKEIYNLVTKYNILLLIDGAHSSHFIFSEKFPLDPNEFCDLCVQSTHKTLECLTQTSILNVNSNKIDRMKLEECIKLVTTTSPSYILMSSIDYGLKLASSKVEHFDLLINVCLELQDFINSNTEIFSLFENYKKNFNLYDSLKLVFNFSKLKICAKIVSEVIFKKFGIKAEMEEGYNLLFIVTCANEISEIENLKNALYFVHLNHRRFGHKNSDQVRIIELSKFEIKLVTAPRKAFYARKKRILIDESVNFVSGEVFSSCPPGIPILIPGQIITSEIVDFMKNFHSKNEISIVIDDVNKS